MSAEPLNTRLEKAEAALAHLERNFDELNSVVGNPGAIRPISGANRTARSGRSSPGVAQSAKAGSRCVWRYAPAGVPSGAISTTR